MSHPRRHRCPYALPGPPFPSSSSCWTWPARRARRRCGRARAFERAANETGVAERMPWAEALDYVRRTMGQSKIDVFTHLAGGDTARAVDATAAFERAYADLIAEEGVEPIAGAQPDARAAAGGGARGGAHHRLRPTTRDAILDGLRWRGAGGRGPLAGRRRPSPPRARPRADDA